MTRVTQNRRARRFCDHPYWAAAGSEMWLCFMP
jgi:hypothetical protein